MKPLLILLVALAPVRLCAFDRGRDQPWIETGDGDGFVGQAVITNPFPDDRFCVGETVTLRGIANFATVSPQDGRASFLVNGTEVCEGAPTRMGDVLCDHELGPNDEGVVDLVLTTRSPNGRGVEDAITFGVDDCVEAEPDSDTEAPDAIEFLSVDLISPQTDSEWTDSDAIPFMVRVGSAEPIDNARVVWLVDGVQVPSMTARTDSDGITLVTHRLGVGPHEAVATSMADGIMASATTQFVVTGGPSEP